MLPRTVLTLAILLGGCAAEPATPPFASVESLAVPSAEPRGEKRFDDLDLALELESTMVKSGSQFEGQLVVENRSGESVVDPGCWLTASSSGIVPPEDPNAELWLQVVVDCSGPHTIHDGEGRRHGVTFIAATKTGDPLPPGNYVAAVEYRGLTHRLEAPLTVVD